MRAIFQRDLASLTRRPLLLALLALLTLGLALLTAAAWPSSPDLAPGEITKLGRAAFRAGCFIQLYFLVLVAPALAAPAISIERRLQTLPLILLSGTTPLAIVLGKLGSRLALIVITLLLPLPMALAVTQLGGLGLDDVLSTLAVLVGFAFFTTSVGLLASGIFDQAHRAALFAYGIAAIPFALPIILPALGLGSDALNTGRYGAWEAAVSPIRAFDLIFEPARFASASAVPPSPLWNPLVLGFAALPLLAAASALLGRNATEPYHSGPGFLGRILEGALTKGGEREPKALQGNPIYWREASARGYRKLRPVHKLNAIVLFAALILLFVSRSSEGHAALTAIVQRLPGASPPHLKIHAYANAGLALLLTIAATVSAAVSVAAERESGLLSLIALSPVDMRTFVYGKTLGIARNLAPLLLLPILYLLASWVAVGFGIVPLIVLLVALPVTAAFAIVQGILCSLVARSPTHALVIALMLLGLEAFLPMCCMPSFNPPYLAYTAIAVTDPARAPDRIIFIVLTLLSTGVHLVALWFVTGFMEERFDQFLGRIGARTHPG